MQEDTGNNQVTLSVWDPAQQLEHCDSLSVRYSRGFLRSTPEKWFPGFDMQWIPLIHSLGVELSIVGVEPIIEARHDSEYAYIGSIDDEPLCVFFDDSSVSHITEAVIPQAQLKAKEVVLEYLAMRLITSLALSWSGPESSLVRFEPDMDPHRVRGVGGVRLKLMMNGNPVTIVIIVGKIMLEKMDSLWRKQLHNKLTEEAKPFTAMVELAHLTVPPTMLSNYVKSGMSYDLETLVSDSVTILANNKPWIQTKLGIVDGSFCVETQNPKVQKDKLPTGTTRLSFVLGSVEVDPKTALELRQVGAILNTGIPVSDKVAIMVNGEKVADATLRSYQGNFAVSVD